MDLPAYLQVEPVGQCNLRCQMCPIQFRQDGPPYGPPAFMPFETFTSLLDAFSDLNLLHLQGLGEPMMHPRFLDMVRYASDRGVRVTTNSNVSLLNERRAGSCVESGLETLFASIDGASAATYESIRVRGHFDRAIDNIRALNAAKASLGSPIPRLKIVMVLMQRNLHELPDLVRLAAQLQAEELSVQHLCHDFAESTLPERYAPMRDFVSCETVLSLPPETVEAVFTESRRLASELGLELRLPNTRQRPHSPFTPGPERCDWPWSGAYVTYDGYLMPCCMISTPDRKNFGRLTERPVEELWNSPDFASFRSALASHAPPEICASCSIYRGTF